MNRKKFVVGGIIVIAILVAIFLLWRLPAGDVVIENQNPSNPNASATTTATSTDATTGASGRSSTPPVPLTKYTVSAVASSLEIGTRFASLFQSTGVAASLKSGTTYTIFVPTDGAFARVTPGVLAKMTATEKKRLIQNHIIVGKQIDVTALYTGQMMTMSGDMVDFVALRPQEPTARVGSGLVLNSYKASNGMVYLINAVLFPPEKKP